MLKYCNKIAKNVNARECPFYNYSVTLHSFSHLLQKKQEKNHFNYYFKCKVLEC